MKKYLKYALWLAGGLLGLVLAIAAYLVATFDPNDYKPQLIQAVKDSKQRTLKLDGDIKLYFFPSLGVSLGKVSLSEFQSEQVFVSVERASVSLKLLPLLARQIVVDEIAVSGVKAQLIKYKNGKANIDDLLGKAAAPDTPAPAPAAESAAPLQFEVAAVHLDEAELDYRDESSGEQYSVQDLNLNTGRIANGVPTTIDLAMRLTAIQPRIDISARMKAVLTIDLENARYRVAGLDLEANGTAFDILGLALKAGGDADVHLSSHEFAVNKLAVSASGTKDRQRFDILCKVPELAGSTHAFKAAELGLDVEVRRAEQVFKLQLATPLIGSFKSQQFNLSDLRLVINANTIPGQTVSGELTGSVQADLGRQSIQARLAGGVAQSRIKAKLAVNNFKVPLIRYDLEIDQFDATPYLPQTTADGKTKTGSASAAAEQSFDLSALQKLNLEGSLRIGSLQAANVKIAQLRVDVKAKNGQINIAPLSAKLYQGSIDGKASLNVASKLLTINEKMTGIAIAPLLKDVADLELLEGWGNVVLDLTTRGNTVSALKQALEGNIAVNLDAGAIKGINLSKLVQGVQRLGKNRSVETTGVDKNEKTPFSEFKAGFRIRNGVAHNNDLAVKSAVLRVTGNGDIDIGHDNLNYNANVIFAKTEQGRTATLPVNVSGPFDSPQFKVDYSALLIDIARQQLDEKKEGLKAKAKEQARAKLQEELKRGLKGLFK